MFFGPFVPFNAPLQVFTNPATELAALNPFAGLAAVNPTGALAALSPAIDIFNPAVNPNAGLLAFNPAGAPTLALSSKAGPATQAVAVPFGYPGFYGGGYPYGFGV